MWYYSHFTATLLAIRIHLIGLIARKEMFEKPNMFNVISQHTEYEIVNLILVRTRKLRMLSLCIPSISLYEW